MDQFPAEQGRDIRALERRIEALEKLVREVRGVPVTQASTAFFLPNVSVPPTPTGGIVLYSLSGSGRWIDSSGTDRSLVPPSVPKGTSVSDPSVSLTSAPGSYSQSHIQSVVNDVGAVKNALVALITSLENADLIFTA